GETPVNKNQATNISTLKAEVARFREELNTRDKLVHQLSQELFRLVKDNTPYAPRPEVAGDYRAEVRLLREQLQGVEQQVHFYQEQLQRRDLEIQQLRQTIRELTERGQMLEQVIRELPKVYTRKFAERLAPIKNKIMSLQIENRQLQAELVAVTDRIAARGINLESSLPDLKLDLPNIALQQSHPPLTVLSHA
ncbi:Npun_F5560 family protein, partial [Chamaesiphon polymorphus]|uniref:Npun_F5560 family protein n=1 Tax=Chamaesiphon polymorphus TaxID=2107691 RepID=UPI003CCC068E